MESGSVRPRQRAPCSDGVTDSASSGCNLCGGCETQVQMLIQVQLQMQTQVRAQVQIQIQTQTSIAGGITPGSQFTAVQYTQCSASVRGRGEIIPNRSTTPQCATSV